MGRQAEEDFGIDRAGAIARVAREPGVDGDYEHVLPVVSRVHVVKLLEGAHEEAGARDEGHRKGNLHDDPDAVQQVRGGTGVARALLDDWTGIEPRGAEGGSESEENPRKERYGGGEGEGPPVRIDGQRRRRITGGDHAYKQQTAHHARGTARTPPMDASSR